MNRTVAGLRVGRKAQLDMQFSWIFILLAGGVILMLFFKVATTQRQLSEDKAAVKLLNDFDAITKAALQTRDTVQSIQLPRIGLAFECSESCACQLNFGRLALPFDDRPIFAPAQIRGQTAKMWVLDWNVPFRVTNFLFVTNEQTKYFIINPGSSEILRRLQGKLPPEVNYEVVTDMGQARNEDYDNAVFVFEGEAQSLSTIASRFRGARLRAVGIKPEGKLTFLDQERRAFVAKESGYLGDEMIFGAVMARDGKLYECNVRTAFSRLLGVALVSLNRANALLQNALPRCAPIYTSIIYGDATQGYGVGQGPCEDSNGPLCRMIASSMKIVDGANVADHHKVLTEAASELTKLNERLLRQSCPVVY